jgi:hypothetical protein
VLGARDGPSPSQWHRAATAARKARDSAAIVISLFGGRSPACGQPQSGTRKGDWYLESPIDGTRRKLRDWLKAEIESQVRVNAPPARIAWALDQLAREAGKRKRANRSGERA